MSLMSVALVIKWVAITAKEGKGNTALSFCLTAKDVLPVLLANKKERFSFKSGCIVWVDNDEMCRLL